MKSVTRILASALMLVISVSMTQANASTSTSLGMAYDNNLSIAIEVNEMAHITVSPNTFSADFHLVQGALDGSSIPFNGYTGVGMFYDTTVSDSEEIGVRFPMGVDMIVAFNTKVYVQVHPELYISDETDSLELELGWAFGVQYTF